MVRRVPRCREATLVTSPENLQRIGIYRRLGDMVVYTNVLETAKNNFQSGIGKSYSPRGKLPSCAFPAGGNAFGWMKTVSVTQKNNFKLHRCRRSVEASGPVH